jgi:hypothetical protein
MFDLVKSTISMERLTLTEDNSWGRHQTNPNREHHIPMETNG